MKKAIKIFSASLLLASALTSCLKDKGFDTQQYGINDPDTQPPGVGFPLGNKSFSLYNTAVNISTSAQAVNGIVYVNLLTGKAPSTDITVTLTINDQLRKNYNNSLPPANLQADSIWQFPSTLYSVPLTMTIPAGQLSAEVPITISNSTTLDPNNTYAIPITIGAASNGYTVAGNMKNLLVNVSVKNQYHGTYVAEGYVYHPTVPRPLELPPDNEKAVSTSGANSVDVGFGDLGSQNFIARYTIDPGTNKVTIAAAPGSAGGIFTQFDTGLPATNPGYTPQWAGSADCNNRYDPTTKTFYIRYGYMGSGGYRVTEEKLTLK